MSMNDLRDRLREIERRPAPEYWDRVKDRVRSVSELDVDPPRAPRRIVVVTVGLLIGLAGVGLVVRAFQPLHDRPTATSTTSSHGTVLPPATAFDPRIAETFPVGPNGQTNSILYADGSLWVTAYGVDGGGGPDRSMLFRIDPATDSIVARIPIRGTPAMETGGGGIAYGDSAIWVTGSTSNSAILQRVDPATETLSDVIPIQGVGGGAVLADASGIWAGAYSNGDRTWVTHLDPNTLQVSATIEVKGQQVGGIVSDEGVFMAQSLYWSGNSGPCGHLSSIDESTNEVIASLDVPDCGSYRLIGWGDRVWAADTSFVPLDPRTAEPSGTSVDYPSTTSAPRGFEVVGPDGAIWYAAYPGGNGEGPDILSRLDPSAGEIHEYAVHVTAIAAAVGPDSIWMLSYDGSITRLALNESAASAATTYPLPSTDFGCIRCEIRPR
jgi:hypothetical protein